MYLKLALSLKTWNKWAIFIGVLVSLLSLFIKVFYNNSSPNFYSFKEFNCWLSFHCKFTWANIPWTPLEFDTLLTHQKEIILFSFDSSSCSLGMSHAGVQVVKWCSCPACPPPSTCSQSSQVRIWNDALAWWTLPGVWKYSLLYYNLLQSKISNIEKRKDLKMV